MTVKLLVIRRLEQVTIGTTVAAFLVTMLVATTNAAVEANPVSAGAVSVVGWLGVGVLALAFITLWFQGLKRVSDERLALAGAVPFAAASVLDLAWNLTVLYRVGVPPLEYVYWAGYAPEACVVAFVGGGLLVRRQLVGSVRELWRRVPVSGSGTTQVTVTVIAAIFLVTSLFVPLVAADISDTSGPDHTITAIADGQPKGLTFGDDGSKLYQVDRETESMNQCTLTTPYTVADGTSDCKGFSHPWGGEFGRDWSDIEFNPDGTRMYIIEYGDGAVMEFHLSTPWDINSASFKRDFIVGEYDSQALAFNTDGTKMFAIGGNTDLKEYELSDPWNVSSASHTSTTSLSIPSAEGLVFSDDGEKLYITVRDNKNIVGYNVTQSYDISSGLTKHATSMGLGEWPVGLAVNPDGTALFHTDETPGTIKEYSTDLSSSSFTGTAATPTPAADSGSDSEYTQEFELVDHTGDFGPETTLEVDESLREYGITAPAGSSDWVEIDTTSVNHNNRAFVDVDEDHVYRLRVRDGSAAYQRAGVTADPDQGTYVIEIGEEITENTTATATPLNTSERPNITVVPYDGGIRVTYDGEPIEDIEYDVVGPDGSVYNVSRDFDEVTGWFQSDLEDLVTGNASEASEEFVVDWSATTSEGEELGGNTSVGESTGWSFGGTDDSSSNGAGGGAGGGGLVGDESGSGASVWLTALPAVAAIGFVAWRRRNRAGP